VSSRTPYTSRGADLADSLPPGIRALLVANGAVFLLQTVLPALRLLPGGWIEQTFGLVSADVFGRGHVWQLATYLFLHGGVFHLLFNMLGLWMFGAEIERTRAPGRSDLLLHGDRRGPHGRLVCVLTHVPA
jgi:membrane associated rhomboid family serine protease